MRVLLIWPGGESAVLTDELSLCEPLPLEYVAGALSDEHEVTIWDARLDPPLERFWRGPDPQLIGLAVPYTSGVRAARRHGETARRLWPGVPIVAGGHHPTVSRAWLDGFPADWLIRGEAGPTFSALADDLAAGRPVAPRDGLLPMARAADGAGFPKPARIDDLPPPDRRPLARHADAWFHAIYRPVGLVRFSAGCPFQCDFCILWRLTDRRYLVQSADKVVAEIASMPQPNLYVVDDEAFIQPDRMMMLADAIAGAGLARRFHMYVRTDTALRRPDVIGRWAETGLDSVLVGAESVDPRDLRDWRKGAEVDETRRAIALFHSLGIKVRANFIIRPDYDRDDFHRLADAVIALGVDMPSYAVLTPLPGTRLWEEVADRIAWDEPRLYDCYHTLLPTRLPLDAFYRHFAELMATTAAGARAHVAAPVSPMFYHGSDGAFGRMVRAIAGGANRHPRSSAEITMDGRIMM
jgi:methyltransferase